MRYRIISALSIVVAVIGWWGLYELTGKVGPEQAGARPLFFALLFLALTATLMPPAAYLNRRFAPQAVEQDPLRFLRHSAWGGLCLAAWAWLQTHRVLNVGFAVVIALMFVAVELLIARMRTEP